MDHFIYHLNFLFVLSILAWALSSYAEIWIYRNIRQTFDVLSRLLRTEAAVSAKTTPPDYLIAQGTYKNRKVVCRLNRFTPSSFLHYNLSLHFYIEPLIRLEPRFPGKNYLTPHTQLHGDNRIHYAHTAATSVRSLFFSNRVSEQEIIGIFEELTRAAEIVETEPR